MVGFWRADLIIAERGLDELHRDTAVFDDPHPETFDWLIGSPQNLVALNRCRKIADLEGGMRQRLNERMQRAVGFKAMSLDVDHPTAAVAGVHAESGAAPFTRLDLPRRYPHVVESVPNAVARKHEAHHTFATRACENPGGDRRDSSQ